MTTIELPNDVALKLFLAANAKNMTVSDYIIFLTKGEYHPEAQDPPLSEDASHG